MDVSNLDDDATMTKNAESLGGQGLAEEMTREMVETILQRVEAGEGQRQIADATGISRHDIAAIVKFYPIFSGFLGKNESLEAAEVVQAEEEHLYPAHYRSWNLDARIVDLEKKIREQDAVAADLRRRQHQAEAEAEHFRKKAAEAEKSRLEMLAGEEERVKAARGDTWRCGYDVGKTEGRAEAEAEGPGGMYYFTVAAAAFAGIIFGWCI